MLNLSPHNSLQSLYLAWLSTKVNLNINRLKIISNNYQQIFEGIEDNFEKIKKIPKNDWIKNFDNLNYKNQLENFEELLSRNQISLVSYLDDNYPGNLNILSEIPIILYYQGSLPALKKQQLMTVVGSRNPSYYSKKIINEILAPICQMGVTIVSGMAYGVDTLAHQTALEKQATTIGVIGSGLDKTSFYPKENWQLGQQILNQNGLIISEYPPETPPNNYNFPKRNRILAALSEITWVIQASIKSGSLITALVAQELGKTVATTPGSIYDQTLGGNLKLLKDGANYISDPEDVIQLLGLSLHPKINYFQTPTFRSEQEKVIWQNLSLEPQPAEQISQKIGLDIQKLSGLLTMLELENLAICIGENKWIRG